MNVKEYMLKLEENLMLGGGRWVADFNESFWGYNLDDVVFDMAITATVRPKGFFLSRVAAWLTTPNYHVVCFVYATDPGLKRLHEVLSAITSFLKQQEFAWAWLVVPQEGAFSRKAKSMVQSTSIREIGIALVDLSSQEIVTSESHLGRRMPRLVGCFK